MGDGWGFFDFTDFIPLVGTALRIGQAGVLGITGHGDEAKHAIAMGGVNLGADLLTVATFGAGAPEAEAARVAAKAGMDVAAHVAANAGEHVAVEAATHGVAEGATHGLENTMLHLTEDMGVQGAAEVSAHTAEKGGEAGGRALLNLSRPTKIGLGVGGAALAGGSLATDIFAIQPFLNAQHDPDPDDIPFPTIEIPDWVHLEDPSPVYEYGDEWYTPLLGPAAAGALVVLTPGLDTSQRITWGCLAFAAVYAYQQNCP